MDWALAIKIFYFVVALFSMSVVALMLQNPYETSLQSNSIKVAKKLNDDVEILIKKAKTPENLTTINSEY